MRFAYIIMGRFNAPTDEAEICNDQDWVQVFGVASMEETLHTAERLRREGVDCIELCGAFGEEGARRVMEATENRIPVGYVTHLPEQDPLYRAVFAQ